MGSLKNILTKDLLMVALFASILTIIIVPLNKTILDTFLIISLSLSLLMLLLSLYIKKPADLTTVPTLILVLALFRLSLNIATTRSILSNGHEGPNAVSDIIASFGEFVVGGNMVIGVIVFIILVLINFIVITKGATRVAEVTARFTLDAIPGKQMAIDADLNAGFIDDREAQRRRLELQKEAQFYGAMDGSSKFVKGDAIAGIIITLVNIIGGLLIGMFQHNLSASESAHIYTILTIGDGLVSQLPALILSTATAIIITRSNLDEDKFATQSIKQLIQDSRSLMFVGFSLFAFSILPGFPSGVLIVLGFIFFFSGYVMYMISQGKDNALTRFFTTIENEAKKEEEIKKKEKIKKKQQLAKPNEKEVIDNIMKMEILELRLGLRLLKLVQKDQSLIDKLKGIRKQIAQELGFIIPQIKIVDDTDIEQDAYVIALKKVEIAKGKVHVGKYLAMGGLNGEKLVGIRVKEPVFGLDAIWINENQKEEATMKGFTVVDAPTIISTHLKEIIKANAADIITRQDIVNIIENLRKDFPIVVDEAMNMINYGLILNVCKNLLAEGIPIIDMLTIIEGIVEVAEYTKASEVVIDQVRVKLARLITSLYVDDDGKVHLVTLTPEAENKLISKITDVQGKRNLNITIAEMNDLVSKTRELMSSIQARGIKKIVIVVDPSLRKDLKLIYHRFGINIPVLAHSELDSNVTFSVEGNLEF